MSIFVNIIELEAKATPGPWSGRKGLLSDAVHVHGEGQLVVGAFSEQDAKLVCELRNRIPQIIANDEWLRQQLSDATQSLTIKQKRIEKLLAVVEAADELADLVTKASEHWPELKQALRKYRKAKDEISV